MSERPGSDWDQPLGAKPQPAKPVTPPVNPVKLLQGIKEGFSVVMTLFFSVCIYTFFSSLHVDSSSSSSSDADLNKPLAQQTESLGLTEECRTWTRLGDRNDLHGMIKIGNRAQNYLKNQWHIDAMDQGEMGKYALRIFDAVERQCRRNPDLFLQAAIDNAINYPNAPSVR